MARDARPHVETSSYIYVRAANKTTVGPVGRGKYRREKSGHDRLYGSEESFLMAQTQTQLGNIRYFLNCVLCNKTTLQDKLKMEISSSLLFSLLGCARKPKKKKKAQFCARP